ncbi:MAG: hypothetical protein JNK04_07960 [Myxococcales bacterium]|nr:hypothetical protein [Myxococcales bacterium]
MPGWKIKSWDRASGRGTIVSAIGTIDFDASVALAADFVLDEEVDVALAPNGDSYCVTRIAPSRWREISPSASLALGSELEKINAELFDRDATVVSLDRDGRLEVELSVDTYAPEMFLVFEGCQFIQLSVELPRLGQLRAFAPDVFVREHKELTEEWPALPSNTRVYRLEPRHFRDAAGYVVAVRVSLVGGPG